jgi:hypothetical protein
MMPNDTYHLWVEADPDDYIAIWQKERIRPTRGRILRMKADAITSGHMYRLPETDDGRQRRLEVIPS